MSTMNSQSKAGLPRLATKTYGSRGKDSFASRAFDEVVLKDKGGKSSTATKAASTIQRWGNTSFTSTRGNAESDIVRKRKVEEPVAPKAAASESLFDDPFSFDDLDDGPKKPKRGMGYKASDDPFDATKSVSVKAVGSSKLKKDENNEEKDTMKKAPNRTYSKGRLSKDTGTNNGKQLSMDSFTTRIAAPSTKQPPVSTFTNVKKFFTSRNKTSAGSSSDITSSQSSSSSPQKPVRKMKAESIFHEGEYDSDFLTHNDSDDPEIVFKNSPLKLQVVDEDKKMCNSPLTVVSGEGDAESDHDTDSVCSSQSQDKTTSSSQQQPKGKFFKSYSKPTSLTSNGSNGSLFCDKLKWDNRPMMKISSLDREDKEKKVEKPVIRRLLTSSPSKSERLKKATYNARVWHDDEEDQDDTNSQENTPTSTSRTSQSKSSPFDDDFDSAPRDPDSKLQNPPKIRRKTVDPERPGFDDPVTKVKITKEHKPLYMVVRNVKQAHECQEHGETQEFEDDVNYIMEGLGDRMPTPVRCLSALSLTDKCVSSAFRMHLRAHGILDTVFKALHDAYKYPTLGLCTSSIMFLVSRDRFSMDLERSTLELMINLLTCDPASDARSTASSQGSTAAADAEDREYMRVQEKIRVVCDRLTADGLIKVELEDISVGQLAMETLLTLTDKRAGDWFKEELRTLGGLDHIVNTVTECVEELDEFVIDPTEAMLRKIKKIERSLRVLENITYLNNDNQSYLLHFSKGVLIKDLCQTLRVCENCMPFNPVVMENKKVDKDCPGYTIFNCLLSILRVLLNITHDNTFGGTRVGQEEGVLKTVLTCILKVPQYIPHDLKFDLLVLGLGLLINLVEHCDHNRELLIDTEAVAPFDEDSPLSKLTGGGAMETLEALAKLFVLRYDAARRIEEEHDAKLEERQAQKAAARRRDQRDHNKSGEWKESESGLEWIAMPIDPEEEIRDAINSDNDDMDFDVIPNPDEDQNVDFTEALHKAGKHMEDCILAAYVGLLLGCTIQGNSEHIERVRDCLPEGDYTPMIRMLRKFLGFMNFTSCVSGSSGSKSITRIIEVLESC